MESQNADKQSITIQIMMKLGRFLRQYFGGASGEPELQSDTESKNNTQVSNKKCR